MDLFARGAHVDKWAYFREVNYNPHARQKEFHQSDARFKVAVAGRRFGKSAAAAREKAARLFERRPDGSGTKGWIVGPTHALGQKEFNYIYDDIVLRLCAGMPGLRATNNPKTGDMRIEMPWGSFVEVKSAEHPKGLVGEGLDWMILAEAAKLPKVIWEKYLRPSLADRRGDADFVTTPEGQNWIYRLHKLGQDPSAKEWDSWVFPSWENPYVYPLGREDPEILALERDMDADEFAQEIAASFTAVVGLIYPEYDFDIHVDDWEYDPRLPNYVFIDHGFTNPTCILQAQVTPNEEVHVWDEYYVPGLPEHEHAEQFLAGLHHGEDDPLYSGWPDGWKIKEGFGDCADPGANTTYSKMFGVPVIGEDEAKDWKTGVGVVKKYLKLRDHMTEEGLIVRRPKLFFHRRCLNLQSEIEVYKRKPKAVSKPDLNPDEKPYKAHDHALDALRMGLMHLFVIGVADSLSSLGDSRQTAAIKRVAEQLDREQSARREEPSPAGLFSLPSKSVFTLGRPF